MQMNGSGSNAAAPLRLLYIDDNPLNLRVAAELLNSVGATVTTAGSAAEGLALVRVQAFDAIVTDIHMPMMSGFEVIAAIRNLPEPASGAPVIALTADLTHNEAHYLAHGFDAFLAKPVTLKPLLNAILRAMTARSKLRRLRQEIA